MILLEIMQDSPNSKHHLNWLFGSLLRLRKIVCWPDQIVSAKEFPFWASLKIIDSAGQKEWWKENQNPIYTLNYPLTNHQAARSAEQKARLAEQEVLLGGLWDSISAWDL